MHLYNILVIKIVLFITDTHILYENYCVSKAKSQEFI